MKYSAKVVTLDGDVIETRGSVTGGSKNALNNNLWHNNNLALIDDALKTLDGKIIDLEKHINVADAPGNRRLESMEKLDSVRQIIDKIGAKKDRIRDNIAHIETEKLGLSDEIAQLTREYFKAETAAQKIDMTIEQMQIRIEEEYAMNYSACHMHLQEFGFAPLSNAGLGAALNRIAVLKRQIATLGNINLDAIEQSKAAQERYDDYVTQVKDLEKAKCDIEKVIHDLSHEMTKRFKETFEKINMNFSHVFKELFGGGSARLELVPDLNGKIDILACGIDIIAEPPGKKLSNLTLLSGGEKALTAIAILFAILKLKPLPFVLLDEVEAALDEANVARFAGYLQNFSHSTQFIVITHRKPTMELADNLYGVTMEEKGVSKIVSVRLESWSKSAVNETEDDMVTA
jgi:chromosome segregation protein